MAYTGLLAPPPALFRGELTSTNKLPDNAVVQVSIEGSECGQVPLRQLEGNKYSFLLLLSATSAVKPECNAFGKAISFSATLDKTRWELTVPWDNAGIQQITLPVVN